MRDIINAAAFKDMMLCADAALRSNIQMINELNVFPVPDGDTGTNMGLTMEKAAAELRKKEFTTVAAAADCVASALLRAARGNSGVILSLLFRGISRGLKGLDCADAKSFADAIIIANFRLSVVVLCEIFLPLLIPDFRNREARAKESGNRRKIGIFRSFFHKSLENHRRTINITRLELIVFTNILRSCARRQNDFVTSN